MSENVNELGVDARTGMILVRRKLKIALKATKEIIERIDEIGDLENGTGEDCAYIAQKFAEIHPAIDIAESASTRAHVLLDVARDALGLSEGGDKCRPWGDC